MACAAISESELKRNTIILYLRDGQVHLLWGNNSDYIVTLGFLKNNLKSVGLMFFFVLDRFTGLSSGLMLESLTQAHICVITPLPVCLTSLRCKSTVFR